MAAGCGVLSVTADDNVVARLLSPAEALMDAISDLLLTYLE